MRVAAVLRCVVTRADDGGGLWCPELVMEATCMHVWTDGGAPSLDTVNCISLFKKKLL
jgi:hypothetical protein